MKNLVFLLLIFIGISGYSQIPEAGDNIILLTTENTPEENYMEFGRYLIEEGFSFDTKDKEFMMMKTAPKNAIGKKGKQGAGHYRFTITFSDTTIRIKPEVELLAISFDVSWYEWEFKSSKSDLNYYYWFYNFKPVLEEYTGKLNILYIKD